MDKIGIGSVSAIGGVLVIAAQTKPDDALSNLAAWKKLATGTVSESGILACPHIDAIVTFLGVILIAGSMGWFLWNRRPNKADIAQPSVHSQKPRIQIAKLGEGNFDQITDTSDRPFMEVGEAGMITATNMNFGSADERETQAETRCGIHRLLFWKRRSGRPQN